MVSTVALNLRALMRKRKNIILTRNPSPSPRHAPPYRHVLLWRRPPLPGHPPHVRLQSPLPNILHPKGLRNAYSAIRPHRRHRRRGRRRRSKVPIRPAHAVPFQPVLPTHAVRDELLLGRWRAHLRGCHHGYYLHDAAGCGLYCEFATTTTTTISPNPILPTVHASWQPQTQPPLRLTKA